MATLLDLSHINLNLQQEVQPANLATQPIQDFNGLDKAGLKASQEFLQSFAKARATTIDIQDEASASTNALDFQKDLSSKLDELQNLEGTKAQEAFNTLPEKIAKARELYGDKNLNNRQKFLFNKKTQDVENGTLIRANSIQAYKAMQERLANMSIEESNKANEVADYAGTKLFDKKVNEFEELIKAHTQERGLTGERAENETRKGMTALMETIASGDIKNKRYGHARAILNKYINKIDGVRRYALLDMITASEANDAQEAERERKANARAEFQLMISSVDRFSKEGMQNQALECLNRAKSLGRYLGYSELALQSYDVETGGRLQAYSTKINQQMLEQAKKDFDLNFGAYKTYQSNGEKAKAEEARIEMEKLSKTLGYSDLVVEAKELEGVRDYNDYIELLDRKQLQHDKDKYNDAVKSYKQLSSTGKKDTDEGKQAVADVYRYGKLIGKEEYAISADIDTANEANDNYLKKQAKEVLDLYTARYSDAEKAYNKFMANGQEEDAKLAKKEMETYGFLIGKPEYVLKANNVEGLAKYANFVKSLKTEEQKQALKEFNLKVESAKRLAKAGQGDNADVLILQAKAIGKNILGMGDLEVNSFIAELGDIKQDHLDKIEADNQKSFDKSFSYAMSYAKSGKLDEVLQVVEELKPKASQLSMTDLEFNAKLTDLERELDNYKGKVYKEKVSKIKSEIKDLRESAKIFTGARKYDKANEANAKAIALEKEIKTDPLAIEAQTVDLQQKAYDNEGKRTMEILKNKGLPQQEQNAMYETYYNQRDAESRRIISERFRKENGHDPVTTEEKERYETMVDSDKKHFATTAVNENNKMVYEQYSQKAREQRDLFNQIENTRDSSGRYLDYETSGAKSFTDFKEMVFRANSKVREQYYSMPEADRKDFEDKWKNKTERREVGNTEQYNKYKSSNLLVEFEDENAIDNAVISYGLNRTQANELKIAWGTALTKKNIRTLDDFKAQQRLELSDGEKFTDLSAYEQERIDTIIAQRNDAIVRYAKEKNLNLGNPQDLMKAEVFVRSNFDFEKSTPSADTAEVIYKESARQRQAIDDGKSIPDFKAFADSRNADALPVADEANFYEGLVKYDITVENGRQVSHHSFVTTKAIQNLVKDMAHTIPEKHYRRVDMANIQDLDDWYYSAYNRTIKNYNDIKDALSKYKKDNGRVWQTKYRNNDYQQTRLDKIIQSMEQ